ncbi:MAG: valine--tRNA ligase [Magnetovibrio sp.]|nr:valine--tRNA ligase [Magnetovibrio sp.]|tara:strand:- start:973 stop:3621 length:2649 start_codon:yes stop_codon:yes gene_type:complete
MLEKFHNHSKVEKKLYEDWENNGSFDCGVRTNAETYTIVIPPPNVTGSLHMGHALNVTLQDIMIRYKRMKGLDVLWQPGTDHAGIATQMVVERQLENENLTRHDLGRKKFIERIWKWKSESGGSITEQLRRLGASCDWNRERFTMDDGLSAAVQKVFVELYKQNLIYRDQRLVNWDPLLHTAISDLEVEQREVNGTMWYFRYPVEGRKGEFISVGTTRPETMLGDTGVAVHPEDKRFNDLIGSNCILPIVGRRIPIVGDEYADPDKGSGAVKITPAHDFNDFEVGRRHGLEVINIFDQDAHMNEKVPNHMQGLDRFEARDKVIAEIKRLDLFEKTEENLMTVPYGDRSGVVIEPWLTDQWFVDAQTMARPAIKAVEQGKTNFVPKNWEKTYFEWMRNIQPWCISRQIWWGHQIPAWYGPDGTVFVELNEDLAKSAADKHYGKSVELERDEDVLDTWFSSALWPFSTLGWPEETPEVTRYYPTDVLVTGFDIIFFWVARMMMFSMHFLNDVPFHTVYIHALVRDENGQKMSKSKGNVIDPLNLVDKYGADALRFTLSAFAAQGRDVKMSESRVEGYRNFCTKLWNAARFAELNGCVSDKTFEPEKCKLTINKWIVGKTVVAAKVTALAIETYRFNDVANTLYQFTWGTFCDWYLEFSKSIFQDKNEEKKSETRATMAWALNQILHLLHPVMPFITEELWKSQYDVNKSMILEPWPELPESLIDKKVEAEMDWVVRLVSQIRTIRSELNISPGANIPLLLKGASEGSKARLETHRNILVSLARLSSLGILHGDVPKCSVHDVIDEAVIIIPLENVIDIDNEASRLEKEITKLKGDMINHDKKLANKNFTAKAPVKIIELERQRRDDTAMTLEKLQDAFTRLKNL